MRYYLVGDIATGKDSDFSEERLIQRFNTDLANSLGNLLNRTLSMAAKYREGILKRSDAATQLISGNELPPLFSFIFRSESGGRGKSTAPT